MTGGAVRYRVEEWTAAKCSLRISSHAELAGFSGILHFAVQPCPCRRWRNE
jgi:hypothetical protein